MAQQGAQAMGTAEVMALIRANSGKGFSGTARVTEGGFRAVPIERVARLDAPPAEIDEPEVVAEAPPPPVDPAVVLAEARAAAYAEGHAAGLAEGAAQGRAAGLAEAETGVVAARDAFVALARRLSVTGLDGGDALAAALTTAVRQMASARAGQAIDALPAPFLSRIETLAERVGQGVRAVTLALHPDDLAAIAPYLAASDLAGAVVAPDPRLARGDVVVRAEGIVLADLIAGAP